MRVSDKLVSLIYQLKNLEIMPQSRQRHKHAHHSHQHSQTHPHTHSKPKGRTATFLAIFLGILGLSIAFLTSDNLLWTIVGGLSGITIGYFVGHNLDIAAKKLK